MGIHVAINSATSGPALMNVQYMGYSCQEFFVVVCALTAVVFNSQLESSSAQLLDLFI